MTSIAQPTARKRSLSAVAFPEPVLYGQPQSGPASISQINPADDLRSKQIAPGNDPRLATAGRQADQAASSLSSWSGYTPATAQTANTATSDGYRNQAASALGSGYVAPTNLSASQSLLNRAAGAGGVGGGGVSYGADTTGLRSQLAAHLGGLGNLPDRGTLAAKAFDLMLQESNPQHEADLRNVGRKTAALGRIGSGMATADLGTVQQRREEALMRTREALANEAAGQTLNDRLGVAGALQSGFGALSGTDQETARIGLQGQELGLRGAGFLQGLARDQFDLDRNARLEGESDRAYGLDRSRAFSGLSDQAFGQGRDLRNEARLDEDRGFDREQAGLSARRGIFGDLSQRESQLYGQGQGYRDELRGERDYQTDAAQRGIDNATRQRLLEDQLLNSEWGRTMDETDLLGRLGYGGYDSLMGQYGEGADRAYQQGDQAWGGVGDLLGEILAKPRQPKAKPYGAFSGEPEGGYF